MIGHSPEAELADRRQYSRPPASTRMLSDNEFTPDVGGTIVSSGHRSCNSRCASSCCSRRLPRLKRVADGVDPITTLSKRSICEMRAGCRRREAPDRPEPGFAPVCVLFWHW